MAKAGDLVKLIRTDCVNDTQRSYALSTLASKVPPPRRPPPPPPSHGLCRFPSIHDVFSIAPLPLAPLSLCLLSRLFAVFTLPSWLSLSLPCA